MRNLLILILLTFLTVSSARATVYYLAPSDAGHPSGGYGGTGTIDDPWHDLNYALNREANGDVQARVRPGDTLYMRGGTYDVRQMTNGVNGLSSAYAPMIWLETTTVSSPTTTIMSYPGEWAILDGGDTKQILQGRHGARQYNIVMKNFEVRNGRGVEGSGLVFGTGHTDVFFINSTFRNLYIHNNGSSSVDGNTAGLSLSGDGCIVEYCTITNNGRKDGSGTIVTGNQNDVNLNSFDYYENSGIDEGPIDVYPRKSNIYRYNKISGVAVGFRNKGMGTFVDATAGYTNALTDRHADWYNEFHHNVVSSTGGGMNCMTVGSDFMKIHHNVFDGCDYSAIGTDGYVAPSLTTPTLIWDVEVYNNTFKGASRALMLLSPSNQDFTYEDGGYDWKVYNNLNIPVSGYGYFFQWWSFDDNRTQPYPMVEDHNGMDSSTGKWFGQYSVNWGGSSGVNLATWQAINNPRYGTGTLGSNDIYTTLSVNSDFSLPSGSAAISAGRSGSSMGAVQYGVDSWYSQAGYYGLAAEPPSGIITGGQRTGSGNFTIN